MSKILLKMGKFLLSFLFLPIIISAQTESNVVLSEIMFFPQSGNNEFIELYNISETEDVDLNGYKIKYQTSKPDIIVSAGIGTILSPKSYAVIFEGDYDLASGIYKDIVPSNALALKIGDNSFGSSGMSNSSDRTISLLNSLDDTLETYIYTADNSSGISDEKINLNKNNSPDNWANSIALNGTPGFNNSVIVLMYDLAFSSVSISPSIPIKNDNVNISAVIKNKGNEIAANYSVEFYNDLNRDSAGSVSELFYQSNSLNLRADDSVTVTTQLQSVQDGKYNLILKIVYNEDDNLNNNTKYFSFVVYPPGSNYNDVVINEIMYAPSSGEPEWVEIFNKTGSSINLKSWIFSDAGNSIKITKEDKYLNSSAYLVISKDSSIQDFYSIPSDIIAVNLPSLNNTGDAVVLKDSLGVIIDSLIYSPSWGGNLNGKSLERVSINDKSTGEENWKTSESKFKATPGIINSVSQKIYDLTIKINKTKNEYVIVGETFQINLKIKNIGLNRSSNYILKVFNDVNKDSIPQVNELFNQLSGNPLNSNDSSLIKIDIQNISEGKNYFILSIEAENDDDLENNIAFAQVTGVKINEIRNDIVINEIMYAPSNSEPEWIELYNRSNKVINLKNYSFADDKDTIKVIDHFIVINPGEYFIVSDDSSIKNFYNIQSKYSVKNFPSLNNNSDKIILLDSIKRVIDSVEYYSLWGGNNGKSLERIDPGKFSTDSSNWKTCKDKMPGTPGRINSVTQKNFDILASEIIFSPQFPVPNDNVKISTKIINIGKSDAIFKIKLFEDTNLDSIPDILINTSDNFNLASGDSIIIQINYVINNLKTKMGFFVVAVYMPDQDTSNNSIYSIIKPGYPERSVIINEIMYNPSGGEPEWIELFNTTDNTINLNGWFISDIVTTPAISQIKNDHFIPPKSYIIIARDSSIFNYHRVITSEIITINLPVLNNDADGVVLRDDRKFTIDSVFYNKDYGGKTGHSIEKISFEAASNLASNWGNSTDIELSTPGRINSIKPKTYDLSISDLSFIPRFPIPGDNVFLSAKIKNNGTATASFSVNFYFDSNSDNHADQLLSAESNINLNSQDSIYITSSESINNVLDKILTAAKINYQNDEDTLNNYFEKFIEPGIKQGTVLINEVMYAPSKDESEWIEIVNVSNDTLNLINWMIGDLLPLPSKYYISTEDFVVSPGEYFVIVHDISFYNSHPDFDRKIKFVNFGTLGNSEDGIIIYDFREGIIDSLKYQSTWGGTKGYSLERISLERPTNDSTNWSTSLSENKSTPGKENSLLNISEYKRNDLLINEIMFDPEVNNSEFIEFYNCSNSFINIGGWKVEDGRGNFYKLSDVSFMVSPNSLFVLSADSQIFNNYDLSNFQNIIVLNTGSLGLSKDETIILKDMKGNIIDSISYSEKWHNKNFSSTKNISLERINPELDGNNLMNWNSSVSPRGATPGKINSIYSENRKTEEKISVSPNPFSPDNDGFEDYTIINYNLTQNTSQVRIKIYDNRGRLLRTLLNNQPSGSKGSVVFNGLEEDGTPFRMGIYIVFLEALNETSGVSETLKTVVVIARKL